MLDPGDWKIMYGAAERDIVDLRSQLAAVRSVCGEAYQLAGAVGAPVKVLDNLSAAMGGMPIPHETFLPVLDTDCSAVREAAARRTR